jgi:hypothetical protein
MDRPRHPNVIRTWVLNRNHSQDRPPLPVKFPNKRKPHGQESKNIGPRMNPNERE